MTSERGFSSMPGKEKGEEDGKLCGTFFYTSTPSFYQKTKCIFALFASKVTHINTAQLPMKHEQRRGNQAGTLIFPF